MRRQREVGEGRMGMETQSAELKVPGLAVPGARTARQEGLGRPVRGGFAQVREALARTHREHCGLLLILAGYLAAGYLIQGVGGIEGMMIIRPYSAVLMQILFGIGSGYLVCR